MVTYNRTPLILGYLVGFIAFIAPVLGFIAPKGLAPLVILGGVVGFYILKSQNRPIFWLNKTVVAILTGLCISGAISIIWSIDSYSASIGTAKLVGNLAAGGIFFTVLQSLNESEQQVALRGLLIGFFFVLAGVALEVIWDGPLFAAIKGVPPASSVVGGPFWLNSIVGLLALLIWPVGIVFMRTEVNNRFKMGILFLILAGFSGVLFLAISIEYSTGVIALLFGIFGACVIWFFGRRAAIAASICLVLIGLLFPFAFTKSEDPTSYIKNVVTISFSAEHRLKIWEFTADKIDQKSLIGWGMNASKDLPDGKSKLYSDTGKEYGDALPLHPHNVILQIWLELGFPGIILYLGLGVFIIMSTVNRSRPKIDSSFMMGQFITTFVIANLSFGVWQAWWIGTLWLSAALMVMVSKKYA